MYGADEELIYLCNLLKRQEENNPFLSHRTLVPLYTYYKDRKINYIFSIVYVCIMYMRIFCFLKSTIIIIYISKYTSI